MVAGAGIGGLAAGIALRRCGYEVTVLERASAARELGAAVVIQPNGSRALAALDVPAPVGAGLDHLTLRSWRGRHLNDTPVARFRERYGFDLRVLLRADLHSVLQAALGPERVTAGAEVSGFEQSSAGVITLLADGRRLEADLLIGADGLRSAVRAQLLGDGAPRYLGCTAWRALTDRAGTGIASDRGLNWWGPGGEFGALPVGPQVYWFATANASAGQDVPVGGRIDDLLHRFGSWAKPIPALIASTEPGAILRNDIYDRAPARVWTQGRVALLGDAAHPMAPNVGQGACQALEDAAALGSALGRGLDIESGLREYQRRRLPRSNQVVRLSRQTSAAVQSENRLLMAGRDLFARLMPERIVLGQMDRLLSGP